MKAGTVKKLVAAHQAGLYRYVRFLGAGPEVAEDVVQDAFLAALGSTSHPDMADERLCSAWLRGVARNVFLTYCRRGRANPVTADSDSLERAEGVWANEFLQSGDGSDYVEALRKCLETLSERDRILLDMRYGQKKSRGAMAKLFKMSVDGIKSLLRRIRASLAECIERRLKAEEA